jgi:hypothetical protein
MTVKGEHLCESARVRKLRLFRHLFFRVLQLNTDALKRSCTSYYRPYICALYRPLYYVLVPLIVHKRRIALAFPRVIVPFCYIKEGSLLFSIFFCINVFTRYFPCMILESSQSLAVIQIR